ncbi:hypothetical protein QVD17_10115 [Tagetes erecta]|uniref:DNA-directed RNA polymerases I and III subunit RPAC2 n=1 Tax=Tagetes erecta TaxID=13708 RepID=A0AAD8L1T1_TARER|nr:hypothetical protein QVD17_10115 [Tagetes erecta]
MVSSAGEGVRMCHICPYYTFLSLKVSYSETKEAAKHIGGEQCHQSTHRFLLLGHKQSKMEHGSYQDQSASTFTLPDEDHTLANALRFTLNQDPRVTVCGYSIPHPSEARVNIRVQTTGDPANEVLKDSCQDLMLLCQHVRSTFDQAVADFKNNKGSESE